jgi:hypothetical protein
MNITPLLTQDGGTLAENHLGFHTRDINDLVFLSIASSQVSRLLVKPSLQVRDIDR